MSAKHVYTLICKGCLITSSQELALCILSSEQAVSRKDTALTLYEDLYTLLQPLTERKKAVVKVSDNGPDWHKISAKTFIAIGCLWRDLKLDYLLLVSHAPRDSKFNPIEHSWAPITIWWSGLVLPAPTH